MSDKQFQIFISYARDDDLKPPFMADAAGFVEYLLGQLDHGFCVSGGERPLIWRDNQNIHRGEHFWPVIESELSKSDLLLVILSKNWIESEWCQKELETFIQCLKNRKESVDERIVVVAKHDIAPHPRPRGLMNQPRGYPFYDTARRQGLTSREYFVHGKPIESLYWPIFDDLFGFLERRIAHQRRPELSVPAANDSGRIVYVAKPARDMFDEYIRVVAELTNRGYKVVPKRTDEIPADRSAQEFIDAALAKAEVSVHLVGESPGWEPEDLEKIVKLQLARAAAKAKAAGKDGATAGPSFQRIIWAPRIFRPEGRSGGQTLERDPFEVLERFGSQLPSDKILGEDRGNFQLSLIRWLDQQTPPESQQVDDIDAQKSPGLGSKVFVLHDEGDRPLARNLRKALREKNIDVYLPAAEGDEVQRKAFDKDSIKLCDSIVLCWGKTSQVWTLAQSRQFSDWRAFGRSQNWMQRSLVLAPPPGAIKAEFKEDPPPSEIDQIIELPDAATISPEVISKLIPHARSVET